MIIITDCQYRMAISAIQYFGKLGKEIIAVSVKKAPPAFFSKYVTKRVTLSEKRDEYIKELYFLCGDTHPFIMPMGVFTLNILAENREMFEKVAHFCVASPHILALANDKKKILTLAHSMGIAVPKEYQLTEEIKFPVVVKPTCGEKFGLKAHERYVIAKDRKELECAYKKFSIYGEPIIEEYINGDGVGVNLLLDKNSNLVTAFCHKRIHEYPVYGGPSASCISFFDQKLIFSAAELLRSLKFSGTAMAEFKYSNGKYYMLEVNPRIWGSFPLALHTKSDFCSLYERAAKNESFSSPIFNFKHEVKMKFIASDIMAALQYIKLKKFGKAFGVLCEILNPAFHEAIFSFSDPKPFFKYIFGGKKA